VRVSDCNRLIRGVGPNAVRRDDVCMQQCGAILFSGPSQQGPPQGGQGPSSARGSPDDGILLDLRPPPPRQTRPPPPSRGPLFNLARLLG
jgi:hypothetical protein